MIELPAFLKPYAKIVAAEVTGVLGWGIQVVNSTPKPVTAAEWLGLAVVAAMGLGIYGATNTPPEPKP